jgi:hypothetical protein
MSEEAPHTIEDLLAERLARFGVIASISGLVVLSAILVGNALVRLLAVAVNIVLLLIINQGPAVAALLGGISTFATYYGWSRIVRQREKLDVREEAKGQAMDQAGNALQNLAGRGCASRLSLGVLGAALVCCVFTYVPSPLHIFGVNGPALLQTSPTATGTSVVATLATPTPAPQPTPQSTPQPTPVAGATPAPTATPIPGMLSLQSPTTIALGTYCGDPFTSASFAFENTGGMPIAWSVSAPTAFHLQSPAAGALSPGATQAESFTGTKANGSISIAWGDSTARQTQRATVTVACTAPPPGKLDVLTPAAALNSYCNTTFSGAEFSFTNTGGTPIYWTVQMPTAYSLESGYPATGTLQPFQGDTQNEFFQGTASDSTITIAWGFSPTDEPYSGTVSTSCKIIS